MQLFSLVAGVTVAVLGLSAQAAELTGRRAPGFALPDAKMQYHDLADLRGKVVLLEIMQTQCPGCQNLARTLQKAKAKYGDRVAVIGVVTPPDNVQTVREFSVTHQVQSPILFDCGQMTGSYLLPDPKHPEIHLPHLFVIDANGVIRNHFDHLSPVVLEGRGLDAAIEGLLAEKKASKAP